MPLKLLLVGVGGFAGSVFRYLISHFLKSPQGFPWATFTANGLGCLLIGLAAGLLSQEQKYLQLLLITGFLGGFTTFSSFGYETISLIQNDQHRLALFNVVAQLGFGGIAVLLGLTIARALAT